MNKSNMATALIMLVIGLGGGWLLSKGFNNTGHAADSADHLADAAEKKPLFYRNPMNPSITSPTPAKGSMGMDYIPVYADDGSSTDIIGTVKIDPTMVQSIGVRTTIARYGRLSRSVRAVGRVDFNEETMTRLHPKVEGWIESIRVNKTGVSIKEDDILLSVYSPQLVSSQQEYLLALNNLEATGGSAIAEIREGAQSLVKSARSRLTLLDVPEHQIKELEQTRKIQKSLHIHSPVSGTAIRIGARKGQHVSPKTELYMIVDLSKVWVFADVYEYELPWVKSGDEVEVTLASVPGKTFTGTLDYIYPYAESKTRTTKVRMVFDNTERLLRPEMLANVLIKSDTQSQTVIVPSQAVIRSGERTQVFVMREPGKFEPRLVTLGIESGGDVSILDGVKAGEKVVTSAQFLVDSESKLREATAKMLEPMSSSDSESNSEKSDGDMDHTMMDSEKMLEQKVNHGEHIHRENKHGEHKQGVKNQGKYNQGENSHD